MNTNSIKKNFSKYIYNRTNGSIMGRTATSWGVGYQPWLKSDPDSTLINFNIREPTSYSKYIDAIENFLKKCNHHKTDLILKCTGTQSNADFVINGKPIGPNIKACYFDTGIFGQNGCGRQNEYGFRDGQPCVILSLNRLIGWKPVDFNESEVPAEVRDRYMPGSVAFYCEGMYDMDKELIGNISYIPPEGIDGRYYPYAMITNYQQPIAMVKFVELHKNRLIMVECSAYAKNIKKDEDTREGMFAFEIFIKDVDPAKNN